MKLNRITGWLGRHLRGKRLPLQILAEPTPLDAESWEWPPKDPNKKHYFERIDDEQIVLNGAVRDGARIMGSMLLTGAGVTGFGVYLFISALAIHLAGFDRGMTWWQVVAFLGDGFMGLTSAALSAFLVYAGLGRLFLSVRAPHRPIIFDRLKGEVTLPPVAWGEPETVAFENLYAARVGFVAGGVSHALYAVRTDGGGVDISIGAGAFIPGSIGSDSVKRNWSFWVWYMDRNRPLPPGTALDPYRAKDLARLRSEALGLVGGDEGPSSVAMPEPKTIEVGPVLGLLGNVFERYAEIDWAAYGGVVYHTDRDMHGLRFDIKTLEDAPMDEAHEHRLMEELLAMTRKRLAEVGYVELSFTSRPRGRVVYSRGQLAAQGH